MHCAAPCSEVHPEVLHAVRHVLTQANRSVHPTANRPVLSLQLAYLMARGGWRFCKCFRNEVTPVHSLIYALLDPVAANYAADDILARGDAERGDAGLEPLPPVVSIDDVRNGALSYRQELAQLRRGPHSVRQARP